MEITDMDRLFAVQNKLSEVKTWVDETLRILHYVCVDEAHRQFTDNEPLSKAANDGLYPGQITEIATAEEDTECIS